jgi:urease accessory protein
MTAAFLAGLLHPLGAPAHALALVGLGLLIGRQTRYAVPTAAFVLALVAGLAALVSGLGETDAPTVLLVASALAGLLTASAVQVPVLGTALLAAAIGGAVGLDSPPQEISFGRAIVALIGTGVGASILCGLVALVAAKAARPWQAVAVRILGSWIAASAILVLALQFVGS